MRLVLTKSSDGDVSIYNDNKIIFMTIKYPLQCFTHRWLVGIGAGSRGRSFSTGGDGADGGRQCDWSQNSEARQR